MYFCKMTIVPKERGVPLHQITIYCYLLLTETISWLRLLKVHILHMTTTISMVTCNKCVCVCSDRCCHGYVEMIYFWHDAVCPIPWLPVLLLSFSLSLSPLLFVLPHLVDAFYLEIIICLLYSFCSNKYLRNECLVFVAPNIYSTFSGVIYKVRLKFFSGNLRNILSYKNKWILGWNSLTFIVWKK